MWGKLKMEDKNKITIECKCINRHGLIVIEYLEEFDEFSLDFYRKYAFRRKKEIEGIIFEKEQAREMVNFLIRKVNEYD